MFWDTGVPMVLKGKFFTYYDSKISFFVNHILFDVTPRELIL